MPKNARDVEAHRSYTLYLPSWLHRFRVYRLCKGFGVLKMTFSVFGVSLKSCALYNFYLFGLEGLEFT